MSFDEFAASAHMFPWLDRRTLLRGGLLTMGTGLVCSLATPALAAMKMPSPSGSYKVAFRNGHTGESFNGVYRVGNKYLPDAFDQINHVLRDFRTGEEFPIDPRSIDILYMLHGKMQTHNQFEILSGYRSPQTNSMLRETSARSGVARNSLHMVGQAIDIRMPDYSTHRIRDLAIDLRAGGVGYYPSSDFVHIDSGKVRHW
jgi:uncharacterized protein YcbK (DUF882 family)